MLSFLNEWLFDSAGLTAHGFCLLWEPGLIWTYAISDTAIGIAYFSIPVALGVIARRRRDLVFRPLLWLFAAFILLCGTTHWLDLLTLWVPAYGLEGVIKAATAIVSIFTALALWRLLPQALAFPSPAQFREASAALASSQEQLNQIQKMEAVGQLTGGIAHDFNNMLAIIIGSLDMARRRLTGAEHPTVPKCINNASEGAERAALLTSRLLAFSRQQPLEPRVIDANKLVSGMSELLRSTIGEPIAVETVLAGGLWRSFADPAQIESALVNLAVNARDAMPTGGRLTIETANTDLDDRYARAQNEVSPGQYVMISVTDTGIGMPPEVIARAFDPFYTTKGVGKGTGLGLSQVFGFVKQSGGHVKIYSEIGRGTTVKLYLPRYFGEAPAMTTDVPSEVLPEGKSSEVILVVEDEANVRHMSVDALRELGYTVMHAQTPSEALQKIETQPNLALLFTDIVMPEMSGRELADRARKRLPGLKVLFTTGYTRNAIVHNGIVDPGMAFLPKPFTLDQLARKIRLAIDGSD
jgi:signal transduction histidine kinase/ActR/RegA family two-component response regulator